LNQDVQLCRKVGAFERDFANGYLFGELLQRHGLLNSFEDDFVDEKTLSAKRTNFELLKDALKGGPASGLGVRLGEEQVAEIMDEDRGASLRLLYQLRRGLLNKGQGGVAVTSGGGTAQEATRLIRQKKGEKEEQFFETRLKKLGKLDDRVRYEMHNKNFADEHAQQMKSSADKEYQDTAAIRGRVHDFKSSLHEKMQQSKSMKGEAKAKGELHWQGVQEKKLRLMEKDLTFEKEMIRRDHQRILDIREHYQKDCGYAETDEAGGIAWFEKNLQRIGIDTSEHAGSTGAAIEASSLKELHEKMIEKLPTKAQLQIESSKRMDKIREAKRNTDVARKERERRQHRVQVEQQATQVAVEEQKGEDDLLSWLLSETAAYRREASDFELQERRKEALWNQREAKQLAYAERAEQESEEAYTKMAARAREERSLKLTLRQEEQERTKLRQAAGMHDPLADDAQSEESSDGEEHDPLGLNADSLSQRSRHTASSAVLPADGPIPEVPELLLVASAEELSFCVREAAISEYLFARGAWTRHQPSEAETVEILQRALQMPGEASQASSAAPRLGSVVQWLCQSPPKELAEAKLPWDFMPVIALTGNTAGLGVGRGTSLGLAATLASRLCQEFGFALIRPQEVLDECLALAQKPPQEPDWPILARMRELGKSVMALINSGAGDAAVSPSTYSEMIFRKIELLASPAPKPVEEEDPKAKKKGKDKVVETPDPIRPSGVLILGFPSDLSQHAAWEAHLRGFCSPLLQLLDSEESQQARLGTVLAPYWMDSGAATPVVLAEAAASALTAAEPKEPARAPPVRCFRLCHPSKAALREAILEEAKDESAWGEAAPGRASLPDGVPAPRCIGFEQDLASASCPADRAWLYEASQVLSTALAQPLGPSCRDLVVQASKVEDEYAEEMTAEQACFREIRDLIAAWQRKPEDCLAPAESTGEEAQETQEAQEALEAQEAQEAEPSEELKVDLAQPGPSDQKSVDEEQDSSVLAAYHEVSAEKKAQLKNTWLGGLSAYLLDLRSILVEVDEEASSYATDLVKMQRRFLDFLQRSDDKGQVIEEFLKSFPIKAPVNAKQVEGLSEQVEELTDKLWLHANHRRQEAVEERERLLTGGFWEEKAGINVRLAERLQALELYRFQTAVAVLQGVYKQDGTAVLPQRTDGSAAPAKLSSLQELSSWLESTVERIVAAETGDEDSGELQAAILAERLGLARRARTAAAWTFARLQAMRGHYDEVFARMDDGVCRRVKEENDAIKATAALLREQNWEDEEPLSPSSTMGTRSGFRKLKSSRYTTESLQTPSSTAGANRRRRDALKAIVPHTLDLDIFTPPKLDVCSNGAAPLLQGAISRAASRAQSQGSAGRSMSKQIAPTPPSRWSQEMLWGLLARFIELGASTGVLAQDQLLQALLERRHGALGYEAEQAAPLPWVRRSEEVYRLLCRSMVEPAWGATGVDVTEFMLALIHNDRGLAWPSLEALEAARALLHSEDSGLTEEETARYPDSPISEELFLKLPLYEAGPDATENLKRWIFQVLVCFENEEEGPKLPANPASRPSTVGTRPESKTSSKDDGEVNNSCISARRLFSYFGLGNGPADGFYRLRRLLLPSSSLEGSEESPAEVRVQDLWSILFSTKSRPARLVAPSPDLATFCTQLLEEGKVKEEAAAPAAKGKAAPKAKGKGKPAPSPGPEEDEETPPPPPDLAAVALSEQVLLQRTSVMQGLCSHGGLLCRRRGLEALFPRGGGFGAPLSTSSEAAALRELLSLVPPPASPSPSPTE
ncbi:unnamed protein product, partial [Polarella glacialis]